MICRRLFIYFLFCCIVLGPALMEGTLSSHRTPTAQEVVSQEAKVIAAVNKIRLQNGLSALSIWDPLTFHARNHSKNMANGSVNFGHGGFESRADKIRKIAPCHSVGENVAYCYLIDDPLKTCVEMWMESPHHRENIFGDYRETGIGIAYDGEGRCYITQLFSKRHR